MLPLAWLYGGVVAARRAAYARGWWQASLLPVPVIVVGNLVVGGAGKTPAVLAIVRLLLEHGRVPGIVSRGHGRRGADHEGPRRVGLHDAAHDVGDEPLLLSRRSGVPVVVGKDRVAAAHALLQGDARIDTIVADDGLQHLALARDIEVVVFDERGAGNGRLLPAGPLREPMPADARPAGASPARLVLYNAIAPTTPLEGYVSTRRAAGLLSLDSWWHGAPPDSNGFAALRGRPIVAACGIGRPERFFALLREQGLDVRPLPLADHFDFAALPWPSGTTDVVVTEKDATKLVPGRAMGARVWVAALDFRPEAPFQAELLERLAALRAPDDSVLTTRPLSTLPLPLER